MILSCPPGSERLATVLPIIIEIHDLGVKDNPVFELKSFWTNPNHPQSNKIQQGEVKKMR